MIPTHEIVVPQPDEVNLADLPLVGVTAHIETLTVQIDKLQSQRAAYVCEAESRLKKMKARKVKS